MNAIAAMAAKLQRWQQTLNHQGHNIFCLLQTNCYNVVSTLLAIRLLSVTWLTITTLQQQTH